MSSMRSLLKNVNKRSKIKWMQANAVGDLIKTLLQPKLAVVSKFYGACLLMPFDPLPSTALGSKTGDGHFFG